MKFVDRVVASVVENGLTLATNHLSVACDGTTTALRDVSLSFPPGTYAGIQGVNGSGKSTLANVLLGLGGRSLAVEGAVTYNGFDIYNPKVSSHERTRLRATLFSYVPKVASLESALSVEDNVLRPYRLTRRAYDESRLRDLLNHFDLADSRRIAVRQLSSGYQQRVNIVRGLLADAPALVLDEPTDALDPANKVFVIQQLKSYASRGTVLIVSHEDTGANRIVRLHGGNLVEPTCPRPSGVTTQVVAAAPVLSHRVGSNGAASGVSALVNAPAQVHRQSS
jgi:ABC-type multidrug transport system ATPase subunit